MFAFALWDERAQSLFLARDRMGQKPLYYAHHLPDVIAFASELSALLKLHWIERDIDPAALADYLRWGYIAAPRTIYRSIGKLPPGTCFRCDQENRIDGRTYFDPNDSNPGESDADAAAQTRHLVTQAAKRRLVADVPLGCLLSGGIDSSIVAAAMKSALGDDHPLQTFSIGFDNPQYDETAHAAEVAAHLGTQHRQFIVRPDAAEDLPRLAAAFGEPFGDSSALPTHYLARETCRHVTVALSGDGGDELFAGYDRYRAMWMAAAFDQMPERLKRIAVSKLWQRIPAIAPKNPIARASACSIL